MQTQLADFIKNTPLGEEADSILRKCVHCGFCTATCPTYQLLNDELDGPRGRIYLIKQILEGHASSRRTQVHLDRCLTCGSCETTCPSGVRYGRLADIGRQIVEEQVKRPALEQFQRWMITRILPFPNRVQAILTPIQWFRNFLPITIAKKIPSRSKAPPWPTREHDRKMLILDGCVQPVVAATINAASARLLDRLGIMLIRSKTSGCCGAISYHLADQAHGISFIKRNIDAWWPTIQQGAEAIVTTASGCGVMLKDYGEILKNDPDYSDKASRISQLTRDISEILADEDISRMIKPSRQKIAFHSPCTLQHGQQLAGKVEKILSECGLELTNVADPHLCCGSAGTYSLLQKSLSNQLLTNKITALEAENPDSILTANIGCLMHLQSATKKPVKHWIELVEAGLTDTPLR